MADTQFVQNIAQILLQAREEIRANMAAKGINASGRTSVALQVRQNGSRIELVKVAGENAPFQTLQYGRAGGNVPGGFRITKAGVRDVSNTFKAILIQWAKNKGFELNWGGATMLARKIAREGTERHRVPRNDIYDKPLEKAVDGVRQEARKYILGSIKAALASGYTNTDL